MSFQARVATSASVATRGDMGRFISQVQLGAQDALHDMAEDGANLSRALAPKGHKPDPRTVPLAGSIYVTYRGNTAHWGSSARHALPQETGSRPHPITGDVSFFWEKHWRMWEPGDNTISHPGNPATHYLRHAYETVYPRWPEYLRKHVR